MLTFVLLELVQNHKHVGSAVPVNTAIQLKLVLFPQFLVVGEFASNKMLGNL